MPAPGGAPGMGGMSPPGGEVSEQLAKMMGSSSGTAGKSTGGSSAVAPKTQPVQQPPAAPPSPREVGTIQDEIKRGVLDIFQGIKEFLNANTWLGINPNTLDPQQQQHAQQLHSRYQQLDQKQQAIAKQMFEERMQKKKVEAEEAERKKQIEEEKAQTIEMPSGPQKGPVGSASGKSKKQNILTKLKQDRTTLSNVAGE